MLVKVFLLFLAVALGQNACSPSTPSDNCQCDYGKCYWWGDPHTRTFDGLVHHFQGWNGYSYRYVTPCTNNFTLVPFQVLARHIACGWWPYVTCTDYVRLRLYNKWNGIFNREIKIDDNYIVTDVTNLYSPATGVSQYYGGGGYYVVTRTWNYVEVSVYTGRMCPYWQSRLAVPDMVVRARYNMRRVEVQLNEYYKSLVCGLCGFWNGTTVDDFTWIYPPASTSPNCYQYSTVGLPYSMASYSWWNWQIVNWFGYRWRDVGNRRLLQRFDDTEVIIPQDPDVEINEIYIDPQIAEAGRLLCEEIFGDAGDDEFCELCGEEVFLQCFGTVQDDACQGIDDERCIRLCINQHCTPGCLGEGCVDDQIIDQEINTSNECADTATAT